ncbi:class I SAM-dependent methyltransferase [Nocardia inohanensis]|uniref:class I SAM-dependent methyltransferase n=1 Tax=Nocardia inohanensis TaxID=209246 RepID=UPI000B2CDD0E|nr:class I SAM-dependent methyltransferase [Nocardia inohanensis]
MTEILDRAEIGDGAEIAAAHQLYAALVAQWQPAMLESASALGIFDVLRSGAASSTAVAKSIGADERSVRVLLDALAAYGWVSGRDGVDGEPLYEVDESVAACLTAGSMYSLIGKIGYNRSVSGDAWRKLDRVVREGISGHDGEIENNGISAVAYEDLVTGINFWAPPIVDKITAWLRAAGWGAGEARDVLDIGCGSGVYGQLLLGDFPAATATGVDAPNILRIAAKQAAALGVGERFEARGADFWTSEWGTGRDLVIFANIFHLVNPSGAEKLLEKARESVADDGIICIVDNIQVGGAETDSPQDRFAALFAVSMMVTGGGATYRLAEYDEWLRVAELERVALLDAPMHRVILARPRREGSS